MGSSSEEEEKGGEMEREIEDQIDPRAEERELKNHLLKKYSGYLSSLKQELSKKKKKGKLPKDARQELLRWWELHNKWPYPSVNKTHYSLFISFLHAHNLFVKMPKPKKRLAECVCVWGASRRQKSWHWRNQLGLTRNR